MKYFIPFKEAIALKNLGFNEHCFATYIGETFDSSVQFTSDDYFTAAPLYQQAFSFFREKYGYYPLIEFSEQYKKWLSRHCNTNGSIRAISVHESYEEAELACLKSIIEIFK
jgi:hypothetical protein